MMKWTLVLTLLAACGEPKGGTEDDPNTACNEANEDCDADTCGGEGGTMLPGSDCLACHDGSDEASKFTAAGTVFTDIDGTLDAEGATVRITDADGTTVEYTANSAGNFYTQDPLKMPISAEVEIDGNILAMIAPVSTGACNSCHMCGGQAGGKLYAE